MIPMPKENSNLEMKSPWLFSYESGYNVNMSILMKNVFDILDQSNKFVKSSCFNLEDINTMKRISKTSDAMMTKYTPLRVQVWGRK